MALPPSVKQHRRNEIVSKMNGFTPGGATYPVLTRNTPNPSSPFTQTGGYGGQYQPLDRSDGTFNSLFGPGYPLTPDPLDVLTPEGRSLPRRTQYLVAANLQLVDRRVPWSVLKGIADDVDVVTRCIQIVQDALVGLDWQWTFSQNILQQIMQESGETNTAKAIAIARDKYGDELQRVQEFFAYPDRRMGFTFSQWLSDIIWSHLTYDGIVIYPQYNLGGELQSLSTIDTATIKILLDNQGFIPRPPAPAYQQILYGFPRGEYTAEELDGDGKVPKGFMKDQLAYYIRRPRPNSVYGYSQVEECVNIATLYMQRQAWLHSEYTHGVTPRMFMTVEGAETWTPEQLAFYEQIMNDRLSGQTQRRQNMFMLRPGMKPEQMKQVDEIYKPLYDEWLIMQMGSKFGVPFQQLGVMGKSSLGNPAKQAEEGDIANIFTHEALKNFMIDCINDMARRFLGVGPELTIKVASGSDDSDSLIRAQADASDVGAGIRTRNEVRADRALPLINEAEADQLAITTGQGVSFLSGQLEAQQKQQEQAMAAPTPPQPGQDGGPSDGSDPEGGRQSTDQAVGGPAAESANNAGPPQSPESNVEPKDDPRQPDTAGDSKDDSPAAKELAQFMRFAKARTAKGKWRDFTFKHQGPADARRLNDAASTGIPAVLKAAVDTVGATSAVAAGIAVRAEDTGRVLMLQRALDEGDAAAGRWEFPGGCLESGESTAQAAVREWQEETGIGLPDGELVGSWTSPDGKYVGYVWEVSSEADVKINLDADSRPIGNPDDPDGDDIETLAWWDVSALPGNMAIRDEVQSTPWHVLGVNQAKALREYNLHLVAKEQGDPSALIDWYNSGADGQIQWGEEGDFDACVALAGKYIDDPQGFCNLRHQDATGGPPGSEGKKGYMAPVLDEATMSFLGRDAWR